MVTKNKIKILDPNQLADRLQKIDNEIAAYEAPLKDLKEKKELVREQLLHALKDNHLDGIKTEDGTTFTRAYRKGYDIVDEKKAISWAVENDCAKVDSVKLGKKLNGNGEAIPAGFEFKSTEYLSVRRESNGIESK